MFRFEFQFEDGRKCTLHAVTFVQAYYAAIDWHTRVAYSSGSHMPMQVNRYPATEVSS